MPQFTPGKLLQYATGGDVPDLASITQTLAENIERELLAMRPNYVMGGAASVAGTVVSLLTRTVTVRAGEVVRIDTSAFTSGNDASGVYNLTVVRGSTEITGAGASFQTNSANLAQTGSLASTTAFDAPPAGTYTYTLRAQRVVGTATVNVARSMLALTKV